MRDAKFAMFLMTSYLIQQNARFTAIHYFLLFIYFLFIYLFLTYKEKTSRGGGEVKMPATPRLRLTGTNARQDVIVYQAIVCTLVHTDVIANVCYALLTQFEKYNSLL